MRGSRRSKCPGTQRLSGYFFSSSTRYRENGSRGISRPVTFAGGNKPCSRKSPRSSGPGPADFRTASGPKRRRPCGIWPGPRSGRIREEDRRHRIPRVGPRPGGDRRRRPHHGGSEHLLLLSDSSAGCRRGRPDRHPSHRTRRDASARSLRLPLGVRRECGHLPIRDLRRRAPVGPRPGDQEHIRDIVSEEMSRLRPGQIYYSDVGAFDDGNRPIASGRGPSVSLPAAHRARTR